MAVSDGQTTAIEMKMRLREKPLSELMEELENLSSISDHDVDLLCAYLDVLEEKAPVSAGRSPAAAFEQFREAHAELFDVRETETPAPAVPRKSRLFRFKQVLVAFAAVFCLLILAAEASGAGLMNRLIEWGTETFSLHPASGVMELKTADENGFRSLQDALDQYGVENAAIPTWIPSRYSIDKITVLDAGKTTVIGGKYVSGEDKFFIRVTIGFKETFTFEENQANRHTPYESNGITFILSTNIDETRANWNIGSYTYNASGNVTESELKEMLDSIQIKE